MDYEECKPKQIFYDRLDCNPADVLFQRRCARYIYVVPEGLRELMSDITREVLHFRVGKHCYILVLRCQPKNVYCFIADYLDALMITRENARVAALFVEDVTEAGTTLREILYRTELTMDEAIRSVRIIQRAFRRYLKSKRKELGQIPAIDPRIVICKMMLRLNISYDSANSAAKIIQHAWRCYKQRMDNWRARFENAIEWREASKYTLQMYKKYAATWEYTRAATIIQIGILPIPRSEENLMWTPHDSLVSGHRGCTQVKTGGHVVATNEAAYRGYFTRRLLKQYSKKKTKCHAQEVLDYLLQQELETGEEDYGYHPDVAIHDSQDGSMQTLYIMYDPEDKAARIIQRTFKKYMRRVTQDKGEDGNVFEGQIIQDKDVRGTAVQEWTTDDLKVLEQQIKKGTEEV